MKKIRCLTIILSLIVFYSCNNDDNFISVYKIDSYHYRFMHYPGSIMPNTDNLVHIEYNNDKVIRRNGGLISASPTSGYIGVFTDIIYDDVTYGLNEIIIELKTYSSDNVSKFKRTLKLDNQSKIIQKIIEKDGYRIVKDTIDFEYNSEGKIIKSSLRYPFYPKESFYYYNSNENLDSIVTKEYFVDRNAGQSYLRKRIVETFENYDDSINPTKNLIIFSETFYRSLSKNNYAKYDKRSFDSNGNLIGHEYRNWSFVYDENGMIQFSPK